MSQAMKHWKQYLLGAAVGGAWAGAIIYSIYHFGAL